MVQHEPVVVAEPAVGAGRPQDRLLAVRDHRQLEPAVEGERIARVPLREHGPGVVDEGDAAREPVAEDREQLVDALPVHDRLREPLVHLERLRRRAPAPRSRGA